MTRVLILTGASLGAKMAGPAIRASAMARVLSADGHEVTLASTSKVERGAALGDFRTVHVRPGDRRAFATLERAAEMIVFQGHGMEQFPALATTDRVVVADAYDPMHLEMLEQGRNETPATWAGLVRSRVALLNQQLSRADLVLCASERQRMLYLGQLAALGRVSPATYADDPRLERLIALAPFGIDHEAPRHERDAMRGVMEGVDDDSRILVWGGGIYSWFDPQVLIRAVHVLATRRPQTRLVFLGTRHPGLDAMGVVKECFDLASTLGILGTNVIFNEDWVPYAERGSFLLEADAGVSTHHAHVETEFSFRTRILDYLWAGLPMVVTEGDSFADLVVAEKLGLVVPAGDTAALEAALERVLYDEAFSRAARRRIAKVRESYRWEATLEPLRALARSPRRAADVDAAGGRESLVRSLQGVFKPPRPPGLMRDIGVGWNLVKNGGLREVSKRIVARRARR